MNVAIGNDGGLTQSCKSQITAISTNLVNTGVDGADKFGDILENIALSVKSGNITFEVENVLANSAEFPLRVAHRTCYRKRKMNGQYQLH